MDPPEVDVSPPHRCLGRWLFPHYSPAAAAAAVSQALLIQWCYWSPSCSELCSQVRRQGLTSPNDRFYGPLLPPFFHGSNIFFLFCFVCFSSFSSFPPSSLLILAFVNKKKESKESRKYGDDNVVHNKVSTRARANVPPFFFSIQNCRPCWCWRRLDSSPAVWFDGLFSLLFDSRQSAFVCFGFVFFFFFFFSRS